MKKNKTLSVIGCLFVILMCLFSYMPLKAETSTPTFQALPWGTVFSNFLPLWLFIFSGIYSIITLYIGTKRPA